MAKLVDCARDAAVGKCSNRPNLESPAPACNRVVLFFSTTVILRYGEDLDYRSSLIQHHPGWPRRSDYLQPAIGLTNKSRNNQLQARNGKPEYCDSGPDKEIGQASRCDLQIQAYGCTLGCTLRLCSVLFLIIIFIIIT